MPDDLSPERQRKARDLARTSRRLSLLEFGLEAFVLAAFLFTGASIALRDWLSGLFFLRIAVYVFITGAAYAILFSPLAYYQSYALPHRYGLSVQNIRSWVADQFKGAALALLMGAAVAVPVYWLLANYPQTWWLLSGVFIVLVSVMLTNLAPVFILPIFMKVKPLTDPTLSRTLAELARRAGVHIRGIYVADVSTRSTTSNAGLMGLGPTRRIVISDTLVQRYLPEEIEAVMAHEMGHHRHGDIPRLMAVQALIIFASLFLAHLALNALWPLFGFAGPGDIANFPLLTLVLGGLMLAASPFSRAFSRLVEMQADSYAMEMASHPKAFISALTKLTDNNLGEARPPRWEEWLFYDHPPYYRRKANAEQYLKNQVARIQYPEERP